jgi:NAD(P)-dependent dehydrogenase (short-subunit alcohol dehydrogenase family)
MIDFEGRTVMLTGAAGAVPGAVAAMFADLGASLLLVDREQARLETLRPRLRRASGVVAAALDLADPQAVEQAFAMAAEQLQGVDVLVTAIGLEDDAPAEPSAEIAWRRALREAVDAVVLTNRAAARLLRPGGCIVNILPAATTQRAAPHPSLAGARGMLRDFTIALAREVAPRGLRANAVAPAVLAAGPSGRHGGRAARPEEVAGAVVLLASPLAGFVSGVLLPVDGGLDGGGMR